VRPLGCLPDPPHRRYGAPLSTLVSPGYTLDALDWSPSIDAGLEQRGSSCVGAALAHALELQARLNGVDLDPSYLAIYTGARELEHPGLAKLPDVGCYIGRAIEWLTTWGVVARARWGDLSPLEQPVPIDVLEAGATATLAGVYRTEETGAARLQRIREALTVGHGVVFGMLVDDAYEAGPGELFDGLTGDSRGGHAQLLVGYRPGACKVLNSWGTRWNGDGYAWLSDAWLAGEHVYDFTVITAAPGSIR